jgi:hypothetical protein
VVARSKVVHGNLGVVRRVVALPLDCEEVLPVDNFVADDALNNKEIALVGSKERGLVLGVGGVQLFIIVVVDKMADVDDRVCSQSAGEVELSRVGAVRSRSSGDTRADLLTRTLSPTRKTTLVRPFLFMYLLRR